MRKNPLLLGALILGAAALGVAAQQIPSALYSGMRWRLVGPFRAGRISAVAGVPGDPATYYIGNPGGGVWKSTSGGEVWKPIFDREPVESIGAIAVAASDPNIIYVGTGDIDNVGGSVNEGNGVYKSTDGGASWRHLGLDATRHIASIVINPRDPNQVLVAALGRTFAPNPERGVYRTSDGGRTWRQVLQVGDRIGAVNLAADPENPAEVFAGLEQHAPRGAAGTAGGGQAGIYKSNDGGATWARISGHGLPDSDLGRIGLAVAAGTRGRRVFAITIAGLYRSDDGGANWRRATQDARVVGSSYFSEVYVAPNNPDMVYVVQTSLYRSTDGGATFSAFKGAPGGDDYHEMWIDPKNPQRMILGVDQGATVSLDGGKQWSLGWYNLANSQFYHIAVDNRFPYWIYGTQQDSGSAAVASRGDFGETTFMDWLPSVGAYEFGYIHPDLSDSNFVFATGGGTALNRYSMATKQIYDITPPAVIDGRSGWRYAGSPQATSPQDAHVFYLGAQAILATHDRGLSWHAISPDLTGAGDGSRAAISALAPSPARAGAFWAGTSNGLVQFTANGTDWKVVTPPGLPANTPIEMIEAAPGDVNTAFVVVERHAENDFAPYVFRTSDGGATWTLAADGIPSDDFLRVVRADPERAGLLYAGTEHGVYVSFDNGGHWQPLQLNLPRTSVRDLVVHGDDLVAATYGRALWILDDVTPLRQVAANDAGRAVVLYRPQTATRVQPDVNYDTPFPPEMPTGENPPAGAVIDYYLQAAAHSPVMLDIVDSSGKTVRHLTSEQPAPEPEPRLDIPNYWLAPPQRLPAAAGMNRAVWDLRYETPPALQHEYPIAALLHDTPSDPRGPFVAPGDYEVQLTVAGVTYKQPLRVVEDPRIHTGQAGLVAQRDLGLRIAEAMRASYDAEQETVQARAQASGLQGADAAAFSALRGPTGGRGRGGRRGGVGPASLAAMNRQLGSLLTLIELSDDAPTATMQQNFQKACQALTPLLTSWNGLKTGALASLHLQPTAAPACQ